MPTDYSISSYTAAISGIAVVLGLDVIAVATRLYVRKVFKTKLKVHDWLVLPALLLNIGMAAALFVGVEKDFLFSRSVTQLPGPELRGRILEAYSTIKKIELAVLLMSFTSLALIKLSFLMFYKRIFVYDHSSFWNPRNLVLNLMILVIIIWDLGFTLTFLSACRNNFSAHWNTTTSKEITDTCINTFLMMYALSISDFITDALILLIPIPMVLKLHLPLRRKFGVLIIFLLGSLATVASLVRMLWMRNIISIGSGPSSHQDPLTLLSNELFWYVIESEIALLAVCLPALSRFRQTKPVEKIIRSVQSKFSLRSGSSSNGNGASHPKGTEFSGTHHPDVGEPHYKREER